ncbi:MAG: 2-hydroxyacid dehydrogenase [Bacilli bacterium]|nr:2-hydroxyacid dehydrogenase [Bacilli bacterium]
MINIAVFDTKSYDKDSFESFAPDNIKFKFFESKLTADNASLIKGFDGVCVFVNDKIDNVIIDALVANGVKAIFLRCAGFNNVDVSYCFGKIHCFRVPAYSPYAVAEFAFALLLTLNRRIHKAFIRTRDYNFSLEGLTGSDLHGKTIGVVGTGKIGQVFINIAKGFGMNVLAYDPYPNQNLDVKYASLEEIYKESDYISLHCPLTERNKFMINKDSIKLMKKGVNIINTSRGALINAEDLLEGIKSRQIGSAGLDVYQEETDIFFSDKSNHILDDDILSRLLGMPNVIITSHQAFLTKEALSNIAETTIENINSFFNGIELSANEVCYHCGREQNCRKSRNKKCF